MLHVPTRLDRERVFRAIYAEGWIVGTMSFENILAECARGHYDPYVYVYSDGGESLGVLKGAQMQRRAVGPTMLTNSLPHFMACARAVRARQIGGQT